MTDIDDLIAALERSPHDSLCAARWPDSSVPRYCDRSVKLKAASVLRAQRAEIARWQELHRVIALELGTEQDTWPDHGNAPLAVAATFMLHRQAAERAEAELASFKEWHEQSCNKLREFVGIAVKRAERAEVERDALRKDAERLIDACNGMIGLIQLIASRDDLPTGLDDLMLLNHRVTEAKAAIDAARAKLDEAMK